MRECWMALLRISAASIVIALTLSACSGGYYGGKIAGSYGTYYRSGSEAARRGDYAKALEDYRFAAKSGHPRALIAYGQLYALGRGVERDPVRAAKILEEAYGKSSKSKSKAALALGKLLLAGGEGPSGELAADPERARGLLIEALDGGERRAASVLGRIYDRGLGVAADPEKAITYYQQVAADDTTAARRLAKLLEEVGAPQQRVAAAMDTAITRLEADADNGKTRALIHLADIYTRSKAVDRDPARAIRYLERVAATGDLSVYVRLATLYGETGQTEREREMLQKAADVGDAAAQTKLARLFLKAGTRDSNGPVGRYYAERAIAQGSQAAMVYLGLALIRGELLEPDPQLGETLLRRAVDAGYLGANTALGASILKGQVPGLYPDEGRELLETAAEKGSTAAMSALGFAYQSGRGVPKDEANALYWLQRAADAGHPTARRFLAEQEGA